MENKLLSIGKNMKRARVYLKMKGYGVTERQNILDKIRHDIPNARMSNCKFLMGVSRMYLDGELNTEEAIFGINSSLRYISDESHCNEYDFNLNGESANTITERFKSVRETDLYEDKKESKVRVQNLKKNNEYIIVPIDNYESASKYGKYTSWCVTQSSGAYDSYTASGAGRFYFCLKKEFEKLPRPSSNSGNPRDTYGLSMIAVSVTMDGECNTITGRYNHDNGGNDSLLDVKDLEKLLGGSFYDMFPPYTEEQLKAKGKYISKVIGKYYLDMEKEIEGVVVSVDENEKPVMIMDLFDEKVMTWPETMEYNKTLKNGWHIPTKEELESIWFVKGWDNIITKKINNGIKRYGDIIYKKLEVDGDYVTWNSPEGEIRYYAKNPIVI